MNEIQQYAIIKGRVVDSNGNPLRKVAITITVSPENSKNDKTNKDGEYSFKFPATDIKDIQLNYYLDKYTTKTINSVYKTSETKTEIIYDIPRVSLFPITDPSQQFASQVNQELNKQENEITKSQLNVPTEAKLATLFNNKKETIKNTLIPFIINLLLEFGTTAAQDILNKKTPSSFDCPSSAKLNELIKKLNEGVVDINYKVNWQHYRNCILLTQHNELKQLNTKIYSIIEL